MDRANEGMPRTGAREGGPPAWPATLIVLVGSYAVAAGVTTLVGWAAGVPRLTSWKNDGISMFPNTAIAAIAAGFAVLSTRAAEQARLTRWLAFLVGTIGGLTLAEHVFGVDLGIDTLVLHREWGQTAAAAPSRMGPPASIAFVLLGLALFLGTLDARRRAIAAGLAVTATAIATLSLTGHLYGAHEMYTIPRLTGISMQTATVIFALGLGMIATLPDREPMRTLVEQSAAGLLARRTLPAIVVAAVTLGWVRLMLQTQGLVDLAFGTAMRTLVELLLLMLLLWWTLSKVREHEQAHRRSETALEQKADELATLLETAAVGMHWVGPDGIILWANDAELRMLGYSRDQFVGHHVNQFHEEPAVVGDVFAMLRRGERVTEYQTRMRCRDGTMKTVLLDATSHWDGDRFARAQCFTRDLTDRARADEGRALLAAIIEASDDAIVSKTLDGVVTSWNAAAQRIFDYTAEEMVGQPIERIIPFERRDEERDILARLRRGERIDHFDTVRRAKDGRSVDVSLTISPVRDSLGRIIGASKIARDVSDRKRLEVEREEADRRKDEFIAMLAHELRNPLAPIQNATRLLELLAPGDPHLVQARDIIRRQVGHLTRMVDDLLDVSRITRGKVTLQKEPLTLDAMVSAAVEVARPLIDQRGHTLTVSHMDRTVRLEGDFARLVQVVSNLLTNAAKFTPAHGHITLATQQTGTRATIRVRDTGVGIPRDLQPQIFDLFVQADDTLARTAGGLGIGLTLVKRLVSLHDGTVEVRSEGEGKGAEFVVTLPALPASLQLPAPPADARLMAGSKSVRILLVEDNPDAAESLRVLLELAGHEVRVASDGLRALKVVDEFEPELAFIDVGLPGIDGYELASRLRALPSCRSTLLIALTGYGRDEDKKRASDAGFDHHLTKPVDPQAVNALVRAAVPRAARATTD